MADIMPLEKPRCAFHPKGLGQRCTNDAIFAVMTSVGFTFWYYPICDGCLPEAGELVEGYILAHLYGYGEEESTPKPG